MSRSIVNWPDIRQRMRSKGITQTQIAEALGIPQSAVSNLLTGARSLKFDEALALERLVGGIFGLPVAIAPLIALWHAAHWHDIISAPDGWVPMPPEITGPKSFAVGFNPTPGTRATMDEGYWIVDPDQVEVFDGHTYLVRGGDRRASIQKYLGNPARFKSQHHIPSIQEVRFASGDFHILGRVTWIAHPV